jgi:hypothetical protein
MYKILHTYFHEQGDALARHMITYPLRQQLDKCWEVEGATPVIDVFANEDRSYCEVFWIWTSKEQYQIWIDHTPDWDFLCEVGLDNCRKHGVHQEHVVPDKEDVLTPREGLKRVTVQQLELEYYLKYNASVIK